ncbi:hypothetical protein GGX14DRAFT_672848 [Mycena pura]|uniref:Uncharacterized protein n=1 Tax=Mycena pura TaxID=153505 RepID=A0AAD6UWG2_9AGAR|nr:hypothetical protein GGX14DRAFT_672848 [Mycena pura]
MPSQLAGLTVAPQCAHLTQAPLTRGLPRTFRDRKKGNRDWSRNFASAMLPNRSKLLELTGHAVRVGGRADERPEWHLCQEKINDEPKKGAPSATGLEPIWYAYGHVQDVHSIWDSESEKKQKQGQKIYHAPFGATRAFQIEAFHFEPARDRESHRWSDQSRVTPRHSRRLLNVCSPRTYRECHALPSTDAPLKAAALMPSPRNSTFVGPPHFGANDEFSSSYLKTPVNLFTGTT